MESAKFLEMWKEIRNIFDAIIHQYDFMWIYRERKINTRFLILFILRLVVPKDERGYGITLMEIFHNFLNFGIENTPKSLAPSAICEARKKLDADIFKEINTAIIGVWNRYNENPLLWHGLRLYGVDGSKLNVPRELLKFDYKTPGDHAHYPQGLLSGLYDLLTGIPVDFDFVNHGNERVCALEHLKLIDTNSVIVYDRGYFSFELLSDHIEEKKHAIFRLQSNTGYKQIDDFWESSDTDIVLLLFPPKSLIKKMKNGSCGIKSDHLSVRLIKYKIDDNTYVLLTTLTDQEKYAEAIFPDAYHSRWGHEEMYKVSKEITGVKDFHSKSDLGIKQELFAHFIIVTLLKIIQAQAENGLKEKKATPPKKQKISQKKKSTTDDNTKPDQMPAHVEKTILQDVPAQNPLLKNQRIDPALDETGDAHEQLSEHMENTSTATSEESSAIDMKIPALCAENIAKTTNKQLSVTEGLVPIHTKNGAENIKTSSDQSEEKNIKVNQKGCFLLVTWVLEKLLYWCTSKFESGIDIMVNSAKKLYQKVRPGRSNPRKSKTPPSKWAHKGNAKTY